MLSALRSPFSALVFSMLLGTIGIAVVSSQIANILPSVFGMSPALASAVIALSGLLSVPTVLIAGWWLGRSGPGPALLWSMLIRAAALLLLAVTGLAVAGPAGAIIASAAYAVTASANALMRSPLTTAAARLTTKGPSEANGLVGAAGAAGAFLGSIGGGLAASVSFELALWVAAIPAVIALAWLPALARGVRARR